MTTSDGIVLIDTPHKPSDALKLKAEIAKWDPIIKKAGQYAD